ncbi:GNAT family N-acetyltransferase [Halapricum salinum]|uniref:GNAT family N-acetyltransferase n=1 Tax=Halapricum salinum TaxID=1457250 RepID=A0A4D6H8W7_9EURY|nr:GNAT family N-acetyltransferase [Halapricum salinum]QCC50353.1 GNAT family N-acetyltransferase [Halapricum salinum]
MDIEPIGTDAGGYTYRPYEPGDEEAIVDLHNAVWDGGRTLAWFRWKYVETPAVEHVPVFVAEHEGEIVGALGLAAYQMWGDGEGGLGVLGSDLVVAESHRRRGIFTSLYRDGTGRYRRGKGVPDAECPDFFFGYANPSSHPGMRKLGAVDVEPRRSFYQVRRPRYYVRDQFGSTVARVLGPVVDAGARRWLRRHDPTPSAGVTVRRHEDVPAETLATLADAARPTGVSPLADEPFYRWRFDGPRWRPDGTYVASRDERPVAATITRTTTEASTGAETVSLIHTVPFGRSDDRDEGVAAILNRVAADSPDAAFLRAWNPVYPERLLRERGFLSDQRRPLSWATGSDLHLVAFDLPESRYSRSNLEGSGPALWSLDK